MLLAALVAVIIPLIFLLLVRRLDLYASGSFRTVLICMGCGVFAFLVSYEANNFFLRFVSYSLLVTLVAPIVEEIIKSLVLVYYVRRPDFTYFVDGAIYGFAVGTTFGLCENLLYISRTQGDTNTGATLALALTRAFSTSLMHGSASALVGVALGRLRFGRGLTRLASVGLGWVAAIGLHLTFNNLISQNLGILTVLLAILLGLGGVAANVGLIRWGLREERQWLRETLGRAIGVSVGESAVVQQMAQLNQLLTPVAARFGSEKRRQVETFLRLQAQLGLKRKVEEMTPDPRLRLEMSTQVAALRAEVDELRRAIGVYCMSYVRSILPSPHESLWNRLNTTLTQPASASGENLWNKLGSKIEEQTGQ